MTTTNTQENMYEVKFTDYQNWARVQEACDVSIDLHSGRLRSVARLLFIKGVLLLSNYKELLTRFADIEEDHVEEFEECREAAAAHMQQCVELRTQLQQCRLKGPNGSDGLNSFPVTTELTGSQLSLMHSVTERLARIYMAQMSFIANVWCQSLDGNVYTDLLRKLEKECGPLINSLPAYNHYSVTAKKCHNDAVVLFNIFRRTADYRPAQRRCSDFVPPQTKELEVL